MLLLKIKFYNIDIICDYVAKDDSNEEVDDSVLPEAYYLRHLPMTTV